MARRQPIFHPHTHHDALALLQATDLAQRYFIGKSDNPCHVAV
jgi:hypothetical protein